MAQSGSTNVPPPPPRATGDAQADSQALIRWAFDFYQKGITNGFLLTDANQFDTGGFDPSSLPDPASSTVARAQQTANEAYTLAAAAYALAQNAQGAIGTLTITGASTTGAVTFSAVQANTNFIVTFSPVTGSTGTPAAGAYVPLSIAKTTSGFTLTLTAAPGVGNSVTYQYRVQAPAS
ncbi:hypothetical protein [Ferrovibrio sp.]|uniref:hypothetical protein n=1 Tax=Ferrovibrio sp. TaxID=1917215 RepID=UPI00311DD7EE